MIFEIELEGSADDFSLTKARLVCMVAQLIMHLTAHV